MDLQVILIFILALLTVNIIVVGVYVIIVLKEFRVTIKKSNEVLDNVHTVTSTVVNPITSLVGVVSGVVEGFKAVKSITSLRDDNEKECE
jgi:hypothetical protein